MPQLDHFSFFSQVFWVLFFFFGWFFFNLRWVLPSIATIFKVRQYVIDNVQSSTEVTKIEESVVLDFLGLSRAFLLSFEKVSISKFNPFDHARKEILLSASSIAPKHFVEELFRTHFKSM